MPGTKDETLIEDQQPGVEGGELGVIKGSRRTNTVWISRTKEWSFRIGGLSDRDRRIKVWLLQFFASDSPYLYYIFPSTTSTICAVMLYILRSLFCFRRQVWQNIVSETESSRTDPFQCDEKRPSCSNCSNHDIECTFATAATSKSDSSAPESSGTPTSRSPRRFRPYQFSTGGLKQTFRLAKPQEPEPQSTNTRSTATQCNILKDTPQSTMSIPDLHLFHHWCISTYCTMRDDDPHNVWQYHIVQWGIEFPPILHLVLALSALHLAYEHPSECEKYLQQADDHFTFGVRTVTNVLSLDNLNADNCQMIYMSATLICFIYFGRGPRPGEYLIFSDAGPAEWLVLMQGVKLTLSSYQWKVFTGILEPKPEEPLPGIEPSTRIEMHEHIVHVQAVESLITEEIPEEDRSPYTSAINGMYDIMEQIYQRRSAQLSGVTYMHLVIGWLYRLQDRFVVLLEQKESRALALLAHWAVMIQFMEKTWFMKGWAEHVLSGISVYLQPEYRPWIEWPLRQVHRSDDQDG
ncbi:hypothetical protein N7532_005762 [Penicillium argentinense]|uniref:Zn(2)-C6 fungal-type domain-containing protein n=1 Tax=Penicillium argentinense TaxID=1131581 RepID=A0A9W9KAP6_9EURO|nr:uncharacterized protein N7532_005762 [Penicillium argentinense]KAJ5098761.1 hypothetical protein N7532_005762 [Penicillium argentinense]